MCQVFDFQNRGAREAGLTRERSLPFGQRSRTDRVPVAEKNYNLAQLFVGCSGAPEMGWPMVEFPMSLTCPRGQFVWPIIS